MNPWARVRLVTLALCFAASQAAFSQGGSQNPQASGWSIAGRVVAADDGRPIAGAEVRAAVLPANLAGAPPPPIIRVKTDENGLFEMQGAVAGRLNLSATASGFLVDTYQPGLQSQLPQIQLGQKLTGITLALPRGAEISGIVRDRSGVPMPNLDLRIFRRGILTVRRAWLDIRQPLVTDARGRFLAQGLQPGEYVVSVPVTSTTFSRSVVDAIRAVPRSQFESAPVSRAILDSRGPLPNAGVEVTGSERVLITSSIGSRFVPSPAVEPGAAALVPRTTYFPDATTLDAAGIITLKSGEQRTDADIQLQAAAAYRIAGTLTSNGAPLAFTGVHLIAEDAAERSSDYDGVAAVTLTDISGKFTLNGVPAGNYSLKVVILPAQPGEPNPISPPASRLTGWASVPVRVVDRNVELDTIGLNAPVTVSGRVEFSGSGAMSPAATAKSTVWLATVDGGMYSPPAAVAVGPDGTFALKGAMRSRYHLWGGSYPGWSVSSVTAVGKNITAAALSVGDRDIDDVVITLTNRLVQVGGTVMDRDGGPAATADVIAFPSDYKRWIADGLSMRVMARRRADPAGRFVIPGLPPGLYLIAAIPPDSATDWPDRRIFESVAAMAQPVAVAEGKPVEVTLTIVSRQE